MTSALMKDVNAALIAAGEHPAARGESGFRLTCDAAGAVLVTCQTASAGWAVVRRGLLVRWLRLLGESGYGWTVTGVGSRRIAAVRVELREGHASE